jgi:hypothetical protein
MPFFDLNGAGRRVRRLSGCRPLPTGGWKLARRRVKRKNSNIGTGPAWRAAAEALIASAILLVGSCDGKENTYAPPPPPKVIVAQPTRETVRWPAPAGHPRGYTLHPAELAVCHAGARKWPPLFEIG